MMLLKLRNFSQYLRTLTLVASGAIVGMSSHAQGTASDSGFEVDRLTMHESGAFWLDGLDFSLIHYTPTWQAAQQSQLNLASGYPLEDSTHWSTGGELAVSDATHPMEVDQIVERLGEESFRVDYSLVLPEGQETQELALSITLPLELAAGRSIIVDDVPYELPPAYQERSIFYDAPRVMRAVVVPAASGTIKIEGEFSVLVQDQRRWKQDGGYTVRLQMVGPVATADAVSRDVLITRLPWHSTAVSIASVVNSSFSDEVAGDQLGGWTDQGAINDLSSMASGMLNAAGVSFNVIDPASNDGLAAIVLGQEMNPQVATVPVPGEPVWRNVYLLHAGAWMPETGEPVGHMIVNYADGTQSSYEVQAGRDVDNWWNPENQTNAIVGWTGANASCPFVGLQVARFPVEEKPLSSIRLEVEDGPLWMVVGLSGSADDLIPFRPAAPLEITAGTQWCEYEHSVEIEPGGVFDYSYLNDAPAGKYGRIITTDEGYFAYADKPGERVRLWGVNLCFGACFMEADEADRLAARLAASGYNTVRFHHFEQELMQGTSEVDPVMMDKLDRLFAAMKARGLYINIDLFVSRKFSAQEMEEMGMDPQGETQAQFKTLVPISEEAFQNWKRFAHTLLTHENPYTGMTWGEDPALFAICPVNENPIEVWLGRTPGARQLYEDAFVSWWSESANQQKAGGDDEVGFSLFLHEKQMASEQRMQAYIRSLGVQALLTGTNFHSTQDLTFDRQYYDYVDNHQYWDHPTFPETKWSLPMRFSQSSVVGTAAQASLDLMAARLWKKPYMVSEFDFVRPNQYRTEAGVFMPAYASLQDWDALYRFDYASHRPIALEGGSLGTFSLASDPIALLGDRVSALLFRRGDIAPGEGAIGYAVRSPEAFGAEEEYFPPSFTRLGLITRIGSGIGTPEEEIQTFGLNAAIVGLQAPMPGGGTQAPSVYRAGHDLINQLIAGGVLPVDTLSADGKRFLSDTGEIELVSDAGAMKVVTPRSELFVLTEGLSLEGDIVSVQNGQTFSSVSVVALDDASLSSSSRLLVLHLTDALPSGMRFANFDRRLMVGRGSMPQLVEKGEAEISLRLDGSKSWQAWSVDATGRREQQVPLVRSGEHWTLNARTVDGGHAQLAYEIVAAGE